MRHAHAKDTFPDEARELSDYGVGQIRALSKMLSPELFSSVAQVWHSPYARARQTAEFFAAKMGIDVPLMASERLTPDGVPELAEREIASLACFDADLLVVAHNPFIEGLARELLGAKSDGYVAFGKAALSCWTLVEHPDAHNRSGVWSLDFLISPSLTYTA